MVIVSFSYPGAITSIFRKEKRTTIRPWNEKWQTVHQKYLKKEKIILQFYYKQRGKFGFKFLELPLQWIEKYSLKDLTEAAAIIDGANNKEELCAFFEMEYGPDYLEKEFARIHFDLDFKPQFKPKETVIEKILDFTRGFIRDLTENDPEMFNPGKFIKIQEKIETILGEC